jgi:tetratricopeptide (TPR) repeat protein
MDRGEKILAAFMLCVSFASAFACSWDSLINNDIWWHLTTGKVILQQKSIPRVDSYSYTRTGAPWIAHSWLAEVLFYSVHTLAGVKGLIFIRSFLAGLIVLALLWTARIQGRGWASAGIAALIAYSVFHYRLLIRPHLFSLLGLALLGLFEEYRRQGQRWAWGAIALLATLWANMHSGVLYGVGFLGCLTFGDFLEETWRLRKFPSWKTLQIALPPWVFFLAGCINPQGLYSFLYPLKMTKADFTFHYIGEFLQPAWTDLLRGILPFAFLGLLRFLWKTKRPGMGHSFAFAIFLFYALKVWRGGADFAIVAMPWAAATLSGAENWLRSRLPRTSTGLFALAGLLAAAGLCALFPPNLKAGIHWRHPVGAAEFIAQENLPGRMYNEIGTGGYLIWRLWPERKVFVDGRLLVYGADFNEHEYGWIAYGAEGWEQKLDAWDVNYIVLRYGARVSSMLYASPNWTLIYFDDAALIYIRNREENRPWLDRWGCTVIDPEDPSLGYLKDRPSIAQAVREAERMVNLRPKAYRPKLILGVALAGMDRIQEAEIQLRAAIELYPQGTDALNNLAALYASSGRTDLARHYWQKTLRVDPHNAPAKENLRRLEALEEQSMRTRS